MKAVWSWFGPPIPDEFRGISEFGLRLAKQSVTERVLVCDQANASRLPVEHFTEVIIRPEQPSKIWSIGKLVAASLMSEPFVHIDFDVLLWAGLPDPAPVLAYSKSNLAVSPRQREWIKTLQLPASWLTPRFDMFECAIFGGTDIERIHRWTDEAIAVAKRLPNDIEPNILAQIVEQVSLFAHAPDAVLVARPSIEHLKAKKRYPSVQNEIEARLRCRDYVQRLDKLINIYTINPENAGDMAGSPCNYFFHGASRHDISGVPFSLANYIGKPVILGGGGLITSVRERTLRWLAENTKLVAWGIGTLDDTMVDISGAVLCGFRDWRNRPEWAEWVPCASCMHESLDAQSPTTYPVGAVERADTPLSLSVPSISTNAPIEAIAMHISKCDCIVTNAYHGMYWATLMGKRVVVVLKPGEEAKFKNFRWLPVFTPLADWQDAVAGAKSYPEAIHVCRARTRAFALQVAAKLGLGVETVN